MAEQIYTEINKFNTTPKLKKIERFPFLLISFSFSLNPLQHIYNRGGSRGRVQGCVPPPPLRDDLRLSYKTAILQKKLCGLLLLK